MRRLLGAAGILLVSAGCARQRAPVRGEPVFLISIDTLRADHLPAYGYKLLKTPAIDGLAADSVLFENAYSHVPLTLPSHSTLLTGLLPPQNAVRDNIGYSLSPKVETLAALLKKQGYETGAAVSTVVLQSKGGLSAGFDLYDDHIEAKSESASLAEIQRSGFESELVAETWLARARSAKVFFFLHLYEPHSPYDPIEPFKTTYKGRPYDGEIATADAIVGKFLAFLKLHGYYDRSLVILLSDHGEGLGQHGEDEHGTLLYRETLHVPLLLKLPGGRGSGLRVRAPVGLTDVFPTVVDAAGAPVPAGLAGRVLPVSSSDAGVFPEREIYSETLYPRYHFGWSDLAALTNARFEYVHAPRPEFYDIVADPEEIRDLAPGLPSGFRRMRAQLLAMDRPRQTPGASDPEQVKKLAALGYLGSAAPPEDAAGLPSPMEHIGELKDLKEGFRLYALRRYPEAIAAFRRLLSHAPRMTDAWGALANCYTKLGRTEEAIAALLEEDRMHSGDPVTLATLANEYLELGDMKNARLYAERSIALNGPEQAHEALASIDLEEGKIDEAEKEAHLALGGHWGKEKPNMLLAQVARARGDLSGALRQLDAVAARRLAAGESVISNLHFQKGDILARLGRNDEAEAEFREELKKFPNNAAAWSSLAFLYASTGRSDEARQTLAEMVRASPQPKTYRAAAKSWGILGDKAQSEYWTRRAAASAEPPGTARMSERRRPGVN